MDYIVTFTAQYLMIFSVLACIYLYFVLDQRKRKSFVLTLFIGGVITLLLAQLGSMLYDNPRPFISDGSTALFSASLDNGFPSDHTLLAAYLGFVAFFYRRWLGVTLLAIAFLVGWARVAGGGHYFVDIVGSFAFAAAGVWVAKVTTDRLLKTNLPEPTKEK